MTTINVSAWCDLKDIVSFIDREFNSDNLCYQLDSFNFAITIFQYTLLLRITIRMGEYTVYNAFPGHHDYIFDDEEFFDINQFFSDKHLLELLDKIKRYLNESH